MRRKIGFWGVFTGMLVGLSCVLVSGDEPAPHDTATIKRDAEAIIATSRKHRKTLDTLLSGGGFSGTQEEINQQWEELLARYEAFDKGARAEVEKALKDFSAVYGDNSMDISNRIHRWTKGELKFDYGPGSAYSELKRSYDLAMKSRGDLAKSIVNNAEQTFQGINFYAVDIQLQMYDSFKRRLQIAAKLDPSNAEVKEWTGKIDKMRSEQSAAIKKAIDGREWRPHSDAFQGPGNPNSLAESAIKYLRSEGWEDKPPRKLLSARVSGDWRQGDVDILGRPINWQLGFEVAFQGKDDAREDIARVFYLSLYTRDNSKNPPWSKVGVGDNYMMRASKIRGVGSSGGPFILFRLALAGSLGMAGFAAAATALKMINPQLATIVDKLAPLKAAIGVAALGVGGLTLLKNLLWLAPLADILPQLAAITIGLLLAVDMLVRLKLPKVAPAAATAEPGGDSADSTEAAAKLPSDEAKEMAANAARKSGEAASAVAGRAQEILEKHRGSIKILENSQIPLGLACMFLAFLHLVLGGWILF